MWRVNESWAVDCMDTLQTNNCRIAGLWACKQPLLLTNPGGPTGNKLLHQAAYVERGGAHNVGVVVKSSLEAVKLTRKLLDVDSHIVCESRVKMFPRGSFSILHDLDGSWSPT